MRARQIGALIEQGDLETAKTQLEETLSEHLEATGTPAAGEPAAGVPETSSYTMTILMLPAWLRWAVATSLVVLVFAVVVWMVFGPEPEPLPETPPTTAVIETPAPVTVPVALGAVTVAALPWAEVREITDADGFVKETPSEPQTPLRLELPPGRYLIQLEHPEHGFEVCEVEVRADEVASCKVEFDRPEVTDYFKEEGWWR